MSHRRRLLSILLLCASALLFSWRAASLSFFDPDEGMYAEIASGMIVSGDFVTPHFNSVRYLEKPPLYFWITALAFRLFGESEFFTRLGAVLGAAGGVGVTFLLGAQAYGTVPGLCTGLILSTAVGYFLFAGVASTDLLFTALIASAFLFFFRGAADRGEGKISWVLFYICLALATLTKGLLGLVFPCVIVGAYLLLTREEGLLKRMKLVWGIPLLLFLLLPWHLLAALWNPDFLSFYLGDNQLLRFFHARAFIEDDVPLSPLTFLGVSLTLFSPWVLFLPSALDRQVVRKISLLSPPDRFALFTYLWAGTVFVFFLISQSSLEHYALPAFPALSLIVGRLWGDALDGKRSTASRGVLLPLIALLCLLSGVIILVKSGVLSRSSTDLLTSFDVYYRGLEGQERPLALPSLEGLFLPLQSLFLLGALFSGAALTCAALRWPRLCFGSLSATSLVLLICVQGVLTALEPVRSVKSLAQQVRAVAGPDDLLIHEGPLEESASLPFYTGRQVLVVNGRRGDLEFGSRSPQSRDLFLTAEVFREVWKGERKVFLVTPLPPAASVLGTLEPGESFFLGSQGFRHLFSNRGG